MIEDIRATIDRKVIEIAGATGRRDPALSPWASNIASAARAVQGFEGWIVAQTIPAALNTAPHLTVVAQPVVHLPERALQRADRTDAPPIHMEFTGAGRPRCLDQMVFHHRSGVIEFGETKRGCQPIGADHRRTRLRDNAALRLIGLSYAYERYRMVATDCRTLVLSYYGRTGLPESSTLRADELDRHYAWPVRPVVEQHLQYFRQRLNDALPGLTGEAA